MKHLQYLLDSGGEPSPSTRRARIETPPERTNSPEAVVALHAEGADGNRRSVHQVLERLVALHAEGADGNKCLQDDKEPDTEVALHAEGADGNGMTSVTWSELRASPSTRRARIETRLRPRGFKDLGGCAVGN